ncbi:hypothetical protein Godav_009502 [Gossypium davidsonii]|uniref:Uncharacterized protein n=1 Tax=Gossypium davidsonii TaxID=34287 RepID=A0A7J8SDE8_GOSDV|nr:hypothetical protein [Gossypium davidsonii]
MVWPGSLSGNGAAIGEGGFVLAPGSSAQYQAPPGWSGRFWGRTGCTLTTLALGNASLATVVAC